MLPRVQFISPFEIHISAEQSSVLIDPSLGCVSPISDADCILITGSQPEHNSEDWLMRLLLAHPKASLAVPQSVYDTLAMLSASSRQIHLASPHWFSCTQSVQAFGIVNSSDSRPSTASYVVALPQGQVFFGATAAPSADLLKQLQTVGHLHTLVLPVTVVNRLLSDPSARHGFTVHEALGLVSSLGANQLTALPQAPTSPEELRLVHQQLQCKANLLVNPQQFYLGRPKASVVVRTLNEARYLEELLQGIRMQETECLDYEVVLVDSGSTDQTVQIAEKYGCRILHISREQFSFGRSLNLGCQAASGEILIITSGHCVPANAHWLQNLCQPLLDGVAQYSYGKQLGGPASQFSERRVFEKYFPSISRIPQQGYYCNNANAALMKSAWSAYQFDEELTGLEDMELAQRLVRDGGRVAYVADAPVYHHHSESWPQVRRRFEREAIALQKIMPHIHVGWFDTLRYTISSIWRDIRHAYKQNCLFKDGMNIMRYRYHQFVGSYRGNHEHRKLSRADKDHYFYPH